MRTALSILTPVTLFIVIGISIDDVYMFIDTYREIGHHTGMTGEKQMWQTVHTAGLATLFTTLTSAAAFAANTVSEVSALRDFGLFTALTITANYVCLIAMIPARKNQFIVCFHRESAQENTDGSDTPPFSALSGRQPAGF